uniref:Putative metalloproteinase n=1 Tax=Megacormus gertschi TaxID=1843536 RepID=A0A224X3S6_9SCOR
MFEVSIQILIPMFFPFLPVIVTEEETDINGATAEILVIMEKNFSDEFPSSSRRQSHICELFKKVNTIFQISGIQLNISLKGLKMIKKLQDQPFLEDHVVKLPNRNFLNATCVYEFNDFSMNQNWHSEYDAIILLTRTSLIHEGNEMAGFAFTSGLCKSWKNTAVAKPTPRTIAHEIGHMLGVDHDSFYYDNKKMPFYYECSPDERYIMGHYFDNLPELNLRFSPCSVDVFRSNLEQRESYDCLWIKNVKDDTARCIPAKITCTMQTLQDPRSGCTDIESIIKQIR